LSTPATLTLTCLGEELCLKAHVCSLLRRTLGHSAQCVRARLGRQAREGPRGRRARVHGGAPEGPDAGPRHGGRGGRARLLPRPAAPAGDRAGAARYRALPTDVLLCEGPANVLLPCMRDPHCALARWRTAATWVCSRARRSERCLSRGQGEDHEPGQSAMNVQLSHEETYAGAVPSSSADPLPHQLRPASCIRSDRCAACPEHDPHKHCVTWEALRVLPRALHASPL